MLWGDILVYSSAVVVVDILVYSSAVVVVDILVYSSAVVVGDIPGTPVSSINQTDRHDRTIILLKVALNTIYLTCDIKLFGFPIF